MSNLFANFKTADLETVGDRTGGFQVLDADIYTGKVTSFYLGESKGGALSMNLEVKLQTGTEYRETIYFTNREKKHFYVRDGKKMPLPGFILVNDICLVTTGKELHELEPEEKVVNVYDRDLQKEVPTKVQMLTEVLGNEISMGILKVIENKNELVGDEYVPTTETREFNRIDKIFHPEAKITVAEAREEKSGFWDRWLAANKGKVRDQRKLKDGQSAPAARTAAPKPGQAAAPSTAPRTNLFRK